MNPFGWGIVALIFILCLAFAWRNEGAALSPDHMQVIQVQPGDTLWSIARQAAGQDRDVRQVVNVIREINGLREAVIHPGQELKVPVYD
nr:LysM peptidoglycan-binding domain-containing protein [Desmospora profundinema]